MITKIIKCDVCGKESSTINPCGDQYWFGYRKINNKIEVQFSLCGVENYCYHICLSCVIKMAANDIIFKTKAKEKGYYF